MNLFSVRHIIYKIGGRQGLNLLIITLFSLILLVTVNWFTIKTNAAIRAFLNSESIYSKAEKDAGQTLILYLHTREEEDYQRFKDYLWVCLDSNEGRNKMDQGASYNEVVDRLRTSENNDIEVENKIWLYQNFKQMPFVRNFTQAWEEATPLILEKEKLGQEAYQKIQAGTFTHDDEVDIMRRIVANSLKLSALEYEFSNQLNIASRKLRTFQLTFSMILIVFLLLFMQVFASRILMKLNTKNDELKVLNQKMSTMVYSVSHDLKSPMASVQGLINLCQMEKDCQKVDEYLAKMSLTLEKQNFSIQKLIQSNNPGTALIKKEELNLHALIEQSIEQHAYMEEAQGINFHNEAERINFHSDEFLLRTIVNNLISNAIKYHDGTKQERFITVQGKVKTDRLILEVIDNGKGIEKGRETMIFEKFYTSHGHNSSWGIGLSFVKENVEKLGGTIQVESSEGTGTRFIISLPIRNNTMKVKSESLKLL